MQKNISQFRGIFFCYLIHMLNKGVFLGIRVGVVAFSAQEVGGNVVVGIQAVSGLDAGVYEFRYALRNPAN